MKSERFEMRLDPHMVQRVDVWRTEQTDKPSRAEAMRRLANTGLAVLGKGSVKISHGERLVLVMLRDLYKHLKVNGDIDPDFVEEAIGGGHYWGLLWKYEGLFRDDVDKEEVRREVLDVLSMWDRIEFGFASLSDEEKEEVERESGLRERDVRFPGFDGNEEFEHLSIAWFLIDHLGRFATFKGRDLNSHCPSLTRYKRMWEVFEPMKQTLIGRQLSGSEIIDLLDARYQSGGERTYASQGHPKR